METFSGQEEHPRWNANLSRQLLAAHVKNITDTYNRATPKLLKGGHEWYERAHETATKIGGGDARKGAGIIAAVSPLTDWATNLSHANSIINTGTAPTFDINARKARRIHEGEDPDSVLGTHGKVPNFFANIADPSNPHPVTIDTHAVNLAVGNPFVGQGGKRVGPKPEDATKVFHSKGRYDHFVRAYKAASEQLGVDIPNKVQAATWVTHRGALG
jgi:hypothetical protein